MPSDSKQREAKEKKAANIARQRQKKKPQKKTDDEKTISTVEEYKAVGDNGDGALQVNETASRAEDLKQNKSQTKSDEHKTDDVGTIEPISRSVETDTRDSANVVPQINEASVVEDLKQKKSQTKSDEHKTDDVGTIEPISRSVDTDIGDSANVVPHVNEASVVEDLKQNKPQTKTDDVGTIEPISRSVETDIGDSANAVPQVNEASVVEAIRSKVPDDLLNFLGQLRPELRNENEPRLLAFCKLLKLKFHGSTPADGNCFFHAVADQLSLMGHPNKSATDLRQKLVNFLHTHQTLQGPDGEIDLKERVAKDWPTYCSDMGKDKQWVDESAVVAMAHMLEKNIMIVTSSPNVTRENCSFTIYGAPNSKDEPLHLGHVYESHYVSLVSDDDLGEKYGEMSHVTSASLATSSAGKNRSNQAPIVKRKPDEVKIEVSTDHPAVSYASVAGASAGKNTSNQTPIAKRKPEEVKIEESKGCQAEQKEKSRQDIASATQQVLESYFQNDEYKNRQKAEMCFYKVTETLSIFVEKDLLKQNRHPASTRDISAILDFLLNHTKFASQEFGGLRKSADQVRRDRNDFVHNYKSEPILPTKILNNYKRNMVELLKNKKLATGKADEARNFIEQVCQVNYVISLEDDLRAKISTLQALMVKVLEKQTTDKSDLKKQMAEMQGQIDELTGKLGELQKAKDSVTEKTTQEVMKKMQLSLIKSYESIETISVSPVQETGNNIRRLEDFYTDVDIEEVEEKKDKQQDKKVTSTRQMFRKGVTRIIIKAPAGCGKSTFCKKLVNTWCSVHKKSLNPVSGDGSSSGTQKHDFEDEDEMLRFEFLLYIDLKNASSESSLLDTFLNQFPLVEQSENQESHPYKPYFESLIAQEESNKVLLILDGLDNMDTSATFLKKIMQRVLYPFMTVLATTRPWKIENLQLSQAAHMDLLLDLKGFSSENSSLFAARILYRYYNFDFADILVFIETLPENHRISSLIHIPLLLLFLVHVWCKTKSFPTTIHKLYFGILNIMVERYVERRKMINQNGDDPYEKKQTLQKNWPLDITAFSSMSNIRNMSLVKHFGVGFLKALFDLADQFLSKDKKVNSREFKEDKLVELLGTDGESKLRMALELGLLSKSESPGVWRKTTVNFIHETMIEFLAAISICCGADRFKTFLSTLNKADDVLENGNIIKFIAGISTNHCEEISVKVYEIPNADTYFDSICRLYKDCVRETHGTNITLKMRYLSADSAEELNMLLLALKSPKDVTLIRLKDIDFTSAQSMPALDIFLHPSLSEIHLTNVKVNDAKLDFLSSTYLTKLILHNTTLRGKSKLILSKCYQLKRVFLQCIEGTNESEIVLSECRNLETLYVRNIGKNDAACTLDLSESTSLTELTLIGFIVSTKSKLVMPKLPQLGKLVLHNVSLENLIVESNCLTELILAYVTVTNGSKLILPELTKLKSILAYNVHINTSVLDLSGSMSLTKVELCNVTLNSDGKMMLSGCQQLRHLNLRNLNMKDFSLDLTESSSLTDLHLLNITGAVKITLSKCTKWDVLELNSVNLNDIMLHVHFPGTIHLSSCIIDNVTMSVTWIPNLLQCVNPKSITIHHVNMGDAKLDLSLCTYLTYLYLSDLTITSDGMRHLFGSLSSCKQLKQLTLYKLDLCKTPLENDMLERLKSLKCIELVNLGKTLDLSKCTCLEYLVLFEVTMASNGMALFENMSHCSHLERLKLGWLDLTNTLLEMDIFKRFQLILMKDVTISSQCAAQIKNVSKIRSCVTVNEGPEMVKYVVNYCGGIEYNEYDDILEYDDYFDEMYGDRNEDDINIKLLEETGEMFLDLFGFLE